MGNSLSIDLVSHATLLRSTGDEALIDDLTEKLIPNETVLLSDIFSILQPEHIRDLRERRPRNLAKLIIRVCE